MGRVSKNAMTSVEAWPRSLSTTPAGHNEKKQKESSPMKNRSSSALKGNFAHLDVIKWSNVIINGPKIKKITVQFNVNHHDYVGDFKKADGHSPQ